MTRGSGLVMLGLVALPLARAGGQCQPSWSAVPGRPPTLVREMTVHDFDGAGSEPARLIVSTGWDLGLVWSFDGRDWRRLGGTFFNAPSTLVSHDPDGPGGLPAELYAAGWFIRDQGSFEEFVIRWNGSDWSTVPGLPGGVWRMCSHDPDGAGPAGTGLYALVELGSSYRVYAKTGSGWDVIGVAPARSMFWADMVSFDLDGTGPGRPALYLGSDFLSISGVPAKGIARWDGVGWAEVGGGVSGSGGTVACLVGFDADGAGPGRAELFVSGAFTSAGSVAVSHAATWDGTRWRGTGGWGAPGFDITTIGPEVSGAGPQVIIGGEITPPRMVTSWDGVAWSALGPGINDPVYAVQEFDEDGPGPRSPRLYVGGEFGRVIGMGWETGHLASWGCGGVCPADLDGDGVVDFVDYLTFLGWFDALDARADLDGDGVVDFTDFLAFLNGYAAGC